MYCEEELREALECVYWTATKAELIDFALRTGASYEVMEYLQHIEDDGEMFNSVDELI